MNDSEPCTSRIMALNSRPANSPCFDGGGGGGGGGGIWDDDDDDNASLWLYLGSVQRKNIVIWNVSFLLLVLLK